ncbi:MAG: pyruvate, phosphate dikinase, partial [Planctomycetia bacterium]|nr:pyruvate, phosphate dikinase [Planctomycetia bacterium]
MAKRNVPLGKYVYSFGGGKAEGKADMKNLLGGKGANLAEMASLGIPVPPGFTITTEVCRLFYENKGKYPKELKPAVEKAMRKIEKIAGAKFGDPDNPLLVSGRSGARQSMPGMMETVLNIGLTSRTLKGLIARTSNPRLAYDAYRRLITMYSDVVMEKAAGIEAAEGKGIRVQLEALMNKMKKRRGAKADTDLTAEDLEELCSQYKAKVRQVLGKVFPDDAYKQLWGSIGAVFQSWNGRRAIAYRRIEGIPNEWGTATNVQAMVFGNTGDDSATGVAFTRNPATGENKFYGEWLVNAQGEDVVAGLRTPNPLNEETRSRGTEHLASLEKAMPKIYKQLVRIRNKLEAHYKDMQDIEFTIENGRLWMLQTRTGKRNGPAAVRMALEMCRQGLIDDRTAVMRVAPEQIEELLHPVLDPAAEKSAAVIASGLPAGPGGAVGQIVFTAHDAVEWEKKDKTVILVREETNPEDVEGMRAAVAILTARGGMTSHAALVARGWGKCCIVGAGALEVDAAKKLMHVDGKTYREGDVVTLNGTKGIVYEGALPLIVGTEENPHFRAFMKLCDAIRSLGVRTNADTPEDVARALDFGAEGVGLFRTEHMFYGKGGEEPLLKLRKMIIWKDGKERRAALKELYPHVKADIKKTLKAMKGLPVTIRLLDPPLHEFLPHEKDSCKALAKTLGISPDAVMDRVNALHEQNPMLGHRGCRLGITYPEITEMQAQAIFEAAAQVSTGKNRIRVEVEVMVP